MNIKGISLCCPLVSDDRLTFYFLSNKLWGKQFQVFCLGQTWRGLLAPHEFNYEITSFPVFLLQLNGPDTHDYL